MWGDRSVKVNQISLQDHLKRHCVTARETISQVQKLDFRYIQSKQKSKHAKPLTPFKLYRIKQQTSSSSKLGVTVFNSAEELDFAAGGV